MQSLAVGGFTPEEVKAALTASSREVRFRYEHLSVDNEHIGWLDGILSASIRNNALARIKRTARFQTRRIPEMDWLRDRIRPWIEFKIKGQWVGWPLGIFLLSTPGRVIDRTGSSRSVEAYSQLIVLVDDKVETRYTVAAGTNIIDEVRTIITGAGIDSTELVPTTETLPVDRDWKPGTSKLEIINDLLDSINYQPLNFSSVGAAVTAPYAAPAERPVGYTYAANEQSVLDPSLKHELDLFGIPNKWVVVVSEPDRPALSSTYTNTNPISPTSTVNIGRTIVDFREETEATSQAVLDAKVARIAFEASQVYERVDFRTALMPHHENAELIEIDYDRLGAKNRYVEHTWTMPLKAGALMRHAIRRVVNV